MLVEGCEIVVTRGGGSDRVRAPTPTGFDTSEATIGNELDSAVFGKTEKRKKTCTVASV